MSFDMSKVAASLRAHRYGSSERFKQCDVSAKTGITSASMSGWESGKRGMTLKNAWTLADFYNVSLDDLVGRKWPHEHD